jgi:DNA-binding transcriptional ArsR family regulator
MTTSADIARIAAAVADPSRACMAVALLAGRALTAGELAIEAGITPQTASAHLARLVSARLIAERRQGRCVYFTLATADAARLLEDMAVLGTDPMESRVRSGPRDPALRRARVCYDHLAGECGVELLDALVAGGRLELGDGHARVTEAGRRFFEDFGVAIDAFERRRRPLCRLCLDWSERRNHLAGSLGAELLSEIVRRGWARREPSGRALIFSPQGGAAFAGAFRPASDYGGPDPGCAGGPASALGSDGGGAGGVELSAGG